MTPAQFQRLDELYARASALRGGERAALVERETDGDPALRAALEGLLTAGEQAGDFLEQPAFDFLASRLGPWRVVRELARGGMGLVYLGERADGQYEQQVAIKITTSAIGTETQLLARLEHPSIARLLDAGDTAAGFRYLVMEYVDGLALDVWVERTQPAMRERLRVFLEICAAVQYAHQNLILHRDLKPSNLLVTAGGTPKLLDFGIAKSMENAGGATATQLPAFTAEYASPEQLQGHPLTTASDVYSLGVLLHLLLAGRPPRVFAGQTFQQVFEEVTAREGGSPAVSGDLGEIIRKATRVDPALRYAAAADLAADIHRHLEGLPVMARPPAFSYRARRMVSRHRWKIAAACVVFLALTTTTAFALWQARAAERRFGQVRRLARSVLFELHDGIEPLSGSSPVRRLLAERALEYLEALSQDAGRDTTLLKEVAEGYLRLGDVQGGPSVRNLGLYEAAGKSFSKANALARQLKAANPRDATLWRLFLRSERPLLQVELAGRSRKVALEKIERHLEMSAEMERLFPGNSDARRIVAEAHDLRAMGYLYNAVPQALDEYLHALALYEKLPVETVGQRSKLAGMHQFLSDEYERRKNSDEALRHVREAIRVQEENLRLNPRSFQARFDVTKGRQQLGSWYLERDRAAEAVEQLRQVAEVRAQLASEEPTDVVLRAWLAQAHSLLGLALSGQRAYVAAVESLERGVAVYRSLLEVEKTSQRFQLAFADSLSNLGHNYWSNGQKEKACRTYEEAAARFRSISQTAQQASLQSGTAAALEKGSGRTLRFRESDVMLR